MSDLSDFKRIVHEPLERELRLCRSELGTERGRREQLEREIKQTHDEWAAATKRAEQLETALREAETLLTNYLFAGKFPPGSDCEAVRDIARAALDGGTAT